MQILWMRSEHLPDKTASQVICDLVCLGMTGEQTKQGKKASLGRGKNTATLEIDL